MNEMLANQYFIVNRFKDACLKFEEILKENPSNNIAKKKLIICYLQLGKVELAFNLFTELLTDSPNTIIKSELNIYEKPCKEMISFWEKAQSNLSDSERGLVLGILWMYCNVNNAKTEFQKLESASQYNMKIGKILMMINNIINQLNKEKENGNETLLS